MAARSNIVVYDGSTPAVQLTFKPVVTADPLVVNYIDRTLGILAGEKTLAIKTRPGRGNVAQKVTLNIAFPTLANTTPSTASGIEPSPSVARTCRAEISYILPQDSTKEERASFWGAVNSTLKHATVENAVVFLDSPY